MSETKYVVGARGRGPFTHIRQPLAAFVEKMEAKLRKNDHKTGWRDQPIEAHIRLLKIELAEFEVARDFLGIDAQMNELVDIANFAMIIHDKLAQEKEAASQPQHESDIPF